MALLGWWWLQNGLSKLPRRSQTQTLHGPGSGDTCVDKLPEQRQPAPCPPRQPSGDEDARGGTRMWSILDACSRWGGWGIGLLVIKIHRAWELTIYPLCFISIPLSPLALNSPAMDTSLTLIGQVINALSQWHWATKKSDSCSQKGWAGVQKSGPTATFSVKINSVFLLH